MELILKKVVGSPYCYFPLYISIWCIAALWKSAFMQMVVVRRLSYELYVGRGTMCVTAAV